ncbi:MAG TPA: ATP-binding protein [Woeseiaceae bacterium]|nr:ATP-binding protein [Woeseiaceae bacterium]
MSHDSETSRERRGPATGRLWLSARPFVLASAVVAVAAIIAPVLQRLPHANLSLLFMTGVLIVAVRYGLWPSIYASLLSFLVFNFFYTAPLYTFKVSEEGDLATLVFFLLMASISGNLAFRMRDAMKKRETATARIVVLQAMTQKVAGAATRHQILQILVDQLADNLTCPVVAIAAEDSSGTAAKHFTSGRIAGPLPGWKDLLSPSTRLPGWTTLPINTKRGLIGAVAINRNIVTREERDYTNALTDQAAIAVERTMLVGDLEEARLVSQREQLRVALLSSVSHDLRTPLSSVIGAASSLLAYESSLSDKDRRELLQSVVEEAERLDRYIQNLLDMTRLGQGELELRRDWEDVRDLISAASRRLRLNARAIQVKVHVSGDAQLLNVHGDLMEQVFVNLLDNAARYSPANATIGINVARNGDAVVIEISDEGPGIPEADREKVFDPFYRVHERDRRSGTGLGLSICRGIVRAHGGEVTAHARTAGSGAVLRLTLPQLATVSGALNG